MDFLWNIDDSILLLIQEYLRHPILTKLLTFITHLGDNGLVWIVLTAGLLLWKKYRNIGIVSAFALLGSLIINNIILKNLIARTRPYEMIEGLNRLIEAQSDFSFPSGHTAASFAAATVMYRKLPKQYGIPILLLAVLIGFSRLYLGVHYPSDVLFGAVCGILIGIGAEYFWRIIRAKIHYLK